MMSLSEEYTVVRQESDSEAPVGEYEQPVVNHVPVKPRPSLRMFLCFFGGLVVGGGLVGYIQSLHPASFELPSAPSGSISAAAEQDSVSYHFLKTTRGMSLLSSLKDTLEKEGPKSTLTKIAELVDADDQVASSCHPLTHMLGRASLDMNGFDKAFGGLIGTDDADLLRLCNAAFMHGIIEHFLGHSTNLQDDVTMIDETVCRQLGNVVQGPWECHHGIGHGVLQSYRLKHQKQALRGALQSCKDTSFSTECENGLWMDHFSHTQVAGEIDPSSLQVCSDLASSQWDCAIYSPTEFLLHNPRSYSSAIDFCRQGLGDDDPKLATTCIEGVGMQAGKENHRNYLPVQQACQTAKSPKEQEACFTMALRYYQMTTGESSVPKSLCRPLDNDKFKDLCHKFSSN